MLRRLFVVLAVSLSPAAFAAGPTQGGPIPVPLPLFPGSNWWNTDISNAPVDVNSASYITFIDTDDPAHKPNGPRKVHGDWGGDADVNICNSPGIYGFPYIIVDSSQPLKTVTFDIPDESDGVDHNTNTSFPFYPIPDEAITQCGWIEDGPAGNVDDRPNSDRHMLIVNKTNNTLYELYNVFYTGGVWTAGSGAFFDMNTNNRRPETWTSADAAGLAMLPGLVRYDEVYGPNEINHALRVTVFRTNSDVFPASHVAGSTAGALPMGARLRLKASKDTSSFSADPNIQKIFTALKKYGLIVADNGSDMFISGTYDTRWDMSAINSALGNLFSDDFEIVQLGWKPAKSFELTVPQVMGTGDAADATLRVFDVTGNATVGYTYSLAIGYTGTIHFTSTDGSASLPADYTFTGADAGTHTFSGGVTLRTAGGQTIRATDVSDATMTSSRIVIVGPNTPTNLVATATTTTNVNLSWSPSSGAGLQYEVQRASAGVPYAILTTTALTSIPDTVAANATYVYRVRAIDSSSRYSPFSIPDAATTMFFQDDPIVAGSTVVKAVHVTELRTAINLMRAAAGLGTFTFTNSNVSGLTIQAVHLQEMRNAVSQARTALGIPTNTFTDLTITVGSTPVKATHFQQLRDAVK